jgi:L-rhamnose mutarotase
VKLLENLNKKYQIAFSLIMAIAIMANVYSTDKYIYERYRSNSVYMYQDKIDILTGCGMNNYFIYRDKYREQLQYLQNRLNKDGRGSF